MSSGDPEQLITIHDVYQSRPTSFYSSDLGSFCITVSTSRTCWLNKLYLNLNSCRRNTSLAVIEMGDDQVGQWTIPKESKTSKSHADDKATNKPQTSSPSQTRPGSNSGTSSNPGTGSNSGANEPSVGNDTSADETQHAATEPRALAVGAEAEVTETQTAPIEDGDEAANAKIWNAGEKGAILERGSLYGEIEAI